jgi:hypothetical protein
MATFTKVLLSGGSQGKAIKVVATASSGTTIHTTGTSSTDEDEIWLYAYNSASTATALTIQFGGTTAVDNDIKVTIPSLSGLTLVVPGLILTGDGTTGATVRAYAATTNVVTISGYVNRIS